MTVVITKGQLENKQVGCEVSLCSQAVTDD